ncbi:MAG: Ig-like domain-containing protein [Solirubrobacterales bacterium]|nr:Ig-like domain-containing protein [Solirubrobacterales bacterium]
MPRLALLLAAALLAVPATASAQEAVTLSAPVDGADLGAGVPTTIEADSGGLLDFIAIQVDGAPKCVLTLRPARCAWTPTQADIGDHTITALSLLRDGAVLSTATARVTVGRLIPPAVSAATVRKRYGRTGRRLTTTGRVELPAGLTASACGGRVTVTVRHGRRTIVDRSVPVGADCAFSSVATFRPPKRASSVRVAVAFAGAPLLAPRAATTQTVRLR